MPNNMAFLMFSVKFNIFDVISCIFLLKVETILGISAFLRILVTVKG